MRTVVILTTVLCTTAAQFNTFNQGQGGLQGNQFNTFNQGQGDLQGNLQPFTNFGGNPRQGEQAFSNFVSNPGQRDFSNFVDLPSQKLRQQQTAGRNPANLSPDCALALPSGGCISYEDVNAAFSLAARNLDYLPLKFPAEGNFSNEEVGNLGTVIHETTRILAKEYQVDPGTATEGFALIDTTKTIISEYCPPYLATKSCEPHRYRDLEGTCNNLKNPHWGAAQMAHHRFLPYAFADGISAPRISVTGKDLPSPRLISAHVHRDEGFHDHAITFLMVAWGQFTDHDITLTAEIDEVLEEDLNCCRGPNVTHPMCFPIEIPENDHFYARHEQRCMNFVRSNAGLRENCRLGPRESFNQITSVMDAGTVYSNVPDTLEDLRSFQGGLMKTLPVFRDLGLQDLLPLSLEDPDTGCIRPSEEVYCFRTGDPRVNEQTVLCILHTLMIRNHNRIAKELGRLNPHWGDETIFQETRHINAALIQHITWNEYLPMVMGKQGLHEHDLVLYTEGYYDGYDPEINPSAANGFATAAYRFGHSLLPSTVERWTPSHKFLGTQKLSEMLQQPYDLFKAGWLDGYVLGLANQVAQAMDDSVTGEVTNHLFEEPGDGFGLDLISLNLQRGREHGIPSYNKYREFCGFKPITSWHQLKGLMPNKTVAAYSRVYDTPEDLELFTAGISENPVPGGLIGPTFSCIIGRQFHNLRKGDRFFYENGGWPSSFTLEQLHEIRKFTLSRLLCDNTDTIDTVQIHAFVLPDHKVNPRVPCNSGVIPRLDLTKWIDSSQSSNFGPQNSFFPRFT